MIIDDTKDMVVHTASISDDDVAYYFSEGSFDNKTPIEWCQSMVKTKFKKPVQELTVDKLEGFNTPSTCYI